MRIAFSLGISEKTMPDAPAAAVVGTAFLRRQNTTFLHTVTREELEAEIDKCTHLKTAASGVLHFDHLRARDPIECVARLLLNFE